MLSRMSLELLAQRNMNRYIPETTFNRTSKGLVGVSLPPPYIVKQYDARDTVKWDGFFQPNHTVTYFQLDVINDNKERRYYGQHYHADNTVYIQDIFNKRNYEFRDNEYQNLAEYHNGTFSLYHKMLVEFYIQL